MGIVDAVVGQRPLASFGRDRHAPEGAEAEGADRRGIPGAIPRSQVDLFLDGLRAVTEELEALDGPLPDMRKQSFSH